MPTRRKKVHQQRTLTLSVRVTRSELAEVRRRAEEDGRTSAGYVRHLLFNRKSNTGH